MYEGFFEEAKVEIEACNLSIHETGCRNEGPGGWYITVETEPLMRLVCDVQTGWIVLEEEVRVTKNGPRFWKDVWIGQNINSASIRRGIRLIVEKRKA
jgi:hypothetical protein